MTTQQDLDWWLELAPTLKWTFARSMPDSPHSYVVRAKTLNERDFMRAVRVIRTFGEPGKFYSMTNIYLTHEGMKWWTMGDTLDGTVIINQATTEQTYGRQDAPRTHSKVKSVYDTLATDYDERYDPEHCAECEDENAEVWKLITGYFPGSLPTTLDVGGGTGLFLDLGLTSPDKYSVVDPSQAMLNELIRKHPKVKHVYPMTFEDYVDTSGEPRLDSFDLVVSLFGSPSYVAPGYIPVMVELAKQMVVLMHYIPGYLPDYHITKPRFVDASRDAALKLPADKGETKDHFVLNNYLVTVLTK